MENASTIKYRREGTDSVEGACYLLTRVRSRRESEERRKQTDDARTRLSNKPKKYLKAFRD